MTLVTAPAESTADLDWHVTCGAPASASLPGAGARGSGAVGARREAVHGRARLRRHRRRHDGRRLRDGRPAAGGAVGDPRRPLEPQGRADRRPTRRCSPACSSAAWQGRDHLRGRRRAARRVPGVAVRDAGVDGRTTCCRRSSATAARFEATIGRFRAVESAALAASAIGGGLLAMATSPRFTYFATLPAARRGDRAHRSLPRTAAAPDRRTRAAADADRDDVPDRARARPAAADRDPDGADEPARPGDARVRPAVDGRPGGPGVPVRRPVGRAHRGARDRRAARRSPAPRVPGHAGHARRRARRRVGGDEHEPAPRRDRRRRRWRWCWS